MDPIQKLIQSATDKIRILKESEFTPLAEIAQLELLLAQTLMQYTVNERTISDVLACTK
jgi:hypothetical protein